MFHVYAIRNESSGKIYIGQTADLERRLKRHNGELKSKRSSYTNRNEGEWKVIYNEGVSSRKEAMARDGQLKTSRGRAFIKSLFGVK